VEEFENSFFESMGVMVVDGKKLYDVDWAFSEVFCWGILFRKMIWRRGETCCFVVAGDEAEFLPLFLFFQYY
jgi:hypothetical protein